MLLDDFFAKLFLSAAKMHVLKETKAGLDKIAGERCERVRDVRVRSVRRFA